VKLVLFDIDGTLLHCGGTTRGPLARALEEVCGTSGSLHRDSFAGKTDDQIVFDALESGGLEIDRITNLLPRVKRRYIEVLDEELDGTVVELLPGVLETLDRLAEHRAIAVGLLTGNWRVGAHWKLSRVGLDGRFAIGAFGDGHRDRAGLPPVAMQAARRHFGRTFTAEEVLIVGDTPNDVRCGRENAMSVAAVATGFAAFEDLQAAGATWVFRDLLDAGFLLPALGLGQEHSDLVQADGGERSSPTGR
jgi:phosphoglycolate phosphatase-like HAD superfamily hydrolase